MEGIKEDHPENPVEKFSIDISAIKSVKIEDQVSFLYYRILVNMKITLEPV